jgi:hypothetical protein
MANGVAPRRSGRTLLPALCFPQLGQPCQSSVPFGNIEIDTFRMRISREPRWRRGRSRLLEAVWRIVDDGGECHFARLTPYAPSTPQRACAPLDSKRHAAQRVPPIRVRNAATEAASGGLSGGGNIEVSPPGCGRIAGPSARSGFSVLSPDSIVDQSETRYAAARSAPPGGI